MKDIDGYVTKDNLYRLISQISRSVDFVVDDMTCSIIVRAISDMPKENVQSVKNGYWEEVTDYGGWGDIHYRCSVCGEEWYLEDGKPKDNNMNFCPRCGAKMDAEPDEPWQSE